MRVPADAALMLGAAILWIAALVHFYWAAGGSAGMARAVPERRGRPLFVPSRGATVAAGLLIGAVGTVYAALAVGAMRDQPTTLGLAVMAALIGFAFFARGIGGFHHVGIFNKGGDTGFARADRLYYSPLCFFLGASGLLAAAARIP